MGQYFKFNNITRNEESQLPLPYNFGLTWIKGLDRYYSPTEVNEIFDYVIKNNNWQESDEILAIGDYGDVVRRPGIEVEANNGAIDLPTLQRVRKEGIEVGRREGIVIGTAQTLRRMTLRALDWNFRPSATTYQTVEKRLNTLQEAEQLEALFAGVMRSANLDEFLTLLPEQQPQPN